MTAWRNGQKVRCWPPLDLGSIQVSIPAFETVTPEIQIFAFESTEDVKQAYESIATISVEVRALRGRRRVTFPRDAFPNSG